MGCLFFFVTTVENVENLCICIQFFPFFVSHAKSGTANNHRNGSSEHHIKAFSVVIRTTLKTFQKRNPVSRKIGLKFKLRVCIVLSHN